MRMPPVGIFSLVYLCWLFSLISCRSDNQNTITLKEANLLLEQAQLDLAAHNYTDALNGFESALNYFEKTGSDSLKIDEIKSLIRQTKAISLVNHFRPLHQNEDKINQPNLLPLTLEDKDFEVLQVVGNPAVSRKWTSRTLKETGEFVGKGRKFTLTSKDGVELLLENENENRVRAIGPAGFTVQDSNVIELTSGSYLVTGKKLAKSGWNIFYPIGEVVLRSDDDFVILIETTTNGGCKIINLVGEVGLFMNKQSQQTLYPGELVFLMTHEFSVKMNIELSTFIATAKIFSAFEFPPKRHRKIRQEALIQALRTKRHYRALVGDAKTLNDFEVKILEEEKIQD